VNDTVRRLNSIRLYKHNYHLSFLLTKGEFLRDVLTEILSHPESGSPPPLEFSFAYNCKTADELTSRIDFDLITFDLCLPDGCGLDILEWLCRTDKFSGKVIVISGDAEYEEHHIRAQELSIDAVFAKPFEWKMLQYAFRRDWNILPEIP